MTRRSETRERIVEEAARLFHDRGYSATGISTILQRAGVNSGSLYHFFPGKEALLVAVLERHLALLEPMILEPAEAAAEDPVERVFALLEFYRRGLLISDFARGCPVGVLALELGDRIPRVRELIDDYFAAWSGRVALWLEAAGDRLPPELDRAALARLALAAMEGGVLQARAALSLDPYEASVAGLRSYLRLLEGHAQRERAEAVRAEEPRLESAEIGHPPADVVGVTEVAEGTEAPEAAETAEPSGWRYW